MSVSPVPLYSVLSSPDQTSEDHSLLSSSLSQPQVSPAWPIQIILIHSIQSSQTNQPDPDHPRGGCRNQFDLYFGR